LLRIATLAANTKQVIGKKYYEELISLNKLFLDNLTKGFLGKEKLKCFVRVLTTSFSLKEIDR
ncbi:MAG: hypothetical protein IJ942_00500, partial [Alistipes sp.]|nr:hypothetical protein [Alistipes sp.]